MLGGWFWNAIWVAAMLWLAGLAWFVASFDKGTPDAVTKVDAIVVLTGGSQRIDSGLRMLVEGKGKEVFVSGVPPKIDRAQILRLSPAIPAWVHDHVSLGHAAGNTVGNARETADWLATRHAHSIRLVTADYHIRRSLIEFRRMLPPDIRIIPDPIHPDYGHFPWRYRIHLIVVEYIKYLLSAARMLLAPGHAYGHGDPFIYSE